MFHKQLFRHNIFDYNTSTYMYTDSGENITQTMHTHAHIYTQNKTNLMHPCEVFFFFIAACLQSLDAQNTAIFHISTPEQSGTPSIPHLDHPSYKKWRCSWLHDDVTDQMETFSALLALCEVPTVTGGFPHKGQWRGALISAWTNNRDAGDLRHHRVHHDVTVMLDNPS